MGDFKEEYPNADMDVDKVQKMAEGHAKWFANIMQPILVSFSVHFYKHGFDDGRTKAAKRNED